MELYTPTTPIPIPTQSPTPNNPYYERHGERGCSTQGVNRYPTSTLSEPGLAALGISNVDLHASSS